MVYYPVLVSEMAKREISRKRVAEAIGVCNKSFSNKLNGKTPFTWPEVKKIHREFFPDILADDLFSTADELKSRPTA